MVEETLYEVILICPPTPKLRPQSEPQFLEPLI